MARIRRQRILRARRLARIRRYHRRRWLRMMRQRRLRRLMMRRLHLRRARQMRLRILRAQRRIKNIRRRFNVLKSRIINLVYQIRHTRNSRTRATLIAQLRALIKQSKILRKRIVRSAVRANVNVRKYTSNARAKAMVKELIKRKARILLKKKIMRAVRVAGRKIHMLKYRIKYNHRKFRRASYRTIRRVCRRFRLGRVHCHKVVRRLHHKIRHISKIILKRYRRRQNRIRANIKKRINAKLVKKTVKGVAKKFERNFNTMGKYRQILDVTCRMDPASCNFFRRSFGDMVPIL